MAKGTEIRHLTWREMALERKTIKLQAEIKRLKGRLRDILNCGVLQASGGTYMNRVDVGVENIKENDMGITKTALEKKLSDLLNCECRENDSNTPDYILAEFMMGCLDAFELASNRREVWYGVELEPGQAPKGGELHGKSLDFQDKIRES